MLTSAVTGDGLEDLLVKIDALMPVDPIGRLKLRVPLSDGRQLSRVQARGRVLHSDMQGSHMILEAEVPESLARQMAEYVLE